MAKYKLCPNCRYLNDALDEACRRCGGALAVGREVDTDEIAAPASATEQARVHEPAGKYRYARRFMSWSRAYASVIYVISMIVLALVALVIMGAGLVAGIGGGNPVAVLSGMLGALLVFAVGWLLVYLWFLLVMASGDLMQCFLQIEENTRAN